MAGFAGARSPSPRPLQERARKSASIPTDKRRGFASPRLRGEGRRRQQACAAGEGEGFGVGWTRKPDAEEPMTAPRPDRYMLAPGLEISRVVTGLWQVADMERDGRSLDPERAADAMADYAADGFDSFDMADHYGSAEFIAGRFLARAH